ncbi:beta-amyrin 11-oxidase-like [Trifolium pratense]|uniref:beta-amyrin 11-oxidase-like n=1 Tax=Trifolium pratense TaxID=57577 RepID=UPI001E691B3D|nr:beta-amyrin 11-oxidase-like [Trifolium pratense]
MDIHIQYCVWTFATLLACYFYVNIFVWRLNEWYYNMKLRKKQYPLPPGHLGWPLIGNMIAFVRDFKSGRPDSFINNLISRYGRTGIYKSHLFGSPSIIISDADMCRRVLTNDENFKTGYPKSTLKLIKCTKSYWSSSRENQKRFKRLITSVLMGHNTLEMYLTRMEDIVINSLEELSSMSHPVDFLKEMKNISFDIIIEIFIGSYNQHIVTKIGNSFTEIYSALWSMPINFPGFAFHKGLLAREKLAKLVQPIVEERRLMKRNGDKKDLLDIFLELRDEEDGWKPEDEDIADMMIGFVLAGHETIANAMMWSIIYLTKNPHVLKKAKEEQEEIIKKRLPTQKQSNLKEIKQMVYLSHIINEVLRLVSMNFANFREATRDVNINGYIIPKGWKVLAWARAVHMDPTYYSNPDEFNPSRWNDHNAKVGTFFPFGAGSMHCPGSDLTKIQISIFLHHFLLNYKLERVNPECPITYLPSSKPKDNCLAKVIKVSSVGA